MCHALAVAQAASLTNVHILQIVQLGAKAQNLEDDNAKLRREAAGELQSPQSKAILHTNAALRTKLTSGVTMLRKCQELLQSAHMKQSAQDDRHAAGLPDIDSFAASCVPLGVADQQGFARTQNFSTSASQHARAHGAWPSNEHTPSPTPQSPGQDAAAFSFLFPPPPPDEQVCIMNSSVEVDLFRSVQCVVKAGLLIDSA